MAGAKGTGADKCFRQELRALVDLLDRTDGVPTVARVIELCRRTREVHMAVWGLRPDTDLVRAEAVPALNRVLELLKKVPPPTADEDRRMLAAVARNVAERVRDITRYASGEAMPLIEPGDRLEGAGGSDDVEAELKQLEHYPEYAAILARLSKEP